MKSRAHCRKKKSSVDGPKSSRVEPNAPHAVSRSLSPRREVLAMTAPLIVIDIRGELSSQVQRLQATQAEHEYAIADTEWAEVAG